MRTPKSADEIIGRIDVLAGVVVLTNDEIVPITHMFGTGGIETKMPSLARTVVAGPMSNGLWLASSLTRAEKAAQ